MLCVRVLKQIAHHHPTAFSSKGHRCVKLPSNMLWVFKASVKPQGLGFRVKGSGFRV